MVGDLIW